MRHMSKRICAALLATVLMLTGLNVMSDEARAALCPYPDESETFEEPHVHMLVYGTATTVTVNDTLTAYCSSSGCTLSAVSDETKVSLHLVAASTVAYQDTTASKDAIFSETDFTEFNTVTGSALSAYDIQIFAVDNEGKVTGNDLSGTVLPVGSYVGQLTQETVTASVPFEVVNVARIADVEYQSVSEALKAATNGQTVTLVESTGSDTETFYVQDGVTLDLNGFVLTAKYVAVFGGNVIDSTNGIGSLHVDSNKLAYNSTAMTYLPVYDSDNNEYKFIDVIPLAEWDQNRDKVWYAFDETAASDHDYQLIQADSTVKMGFYLTYTVTSGDVSKTMTMSFETNSNVFQDYLSKQRETEHQAMYTTFIAGEGIQLTSVQPYVVSGDNANFNLSGRKVDKQ